MAEKLVFDVLARASGTADVRKLGDAIDDVGKRVDDLGKKSAGDGSGFFSKFTAGAKKAADSVGTTFTKMSADLEKHGRQGGDSFAAGLTAGFTGVFGKIGAALTDVQAGFSAGWSGTGERAAREFVESFTRDAEGRLRDSKGRFVSAASDTYKAYTDALSKMSDGGGNTTKLGFFGRLAEQAASAGVSIAGELSKGLSKSLADVGPIAPVLFGALIGAAPIAGATIGGLIVAGISAAGIGAGIALAFRDPVIKAEAGALGKTVLDGLSKAADGFKPALQASFATLGEGFQKALPDLRTFFTNLQGSVEPIAESLSRMGQALSSGLADATREAGPVLEATFEGLEAIVTSLSDGFAALGDNGAEAATAISFTFKTIALVVGEALATVDLFLDAFGLLASSGVLGPGIAAEWTRYKAEVEGGSQALDSVKTSAEGAKAAMQAVQDEMLAQIDPAFNLWKQTNDLADARTKLSEAEQKYGANSSQAREAAAGLAKQALELTAAYGDMATQVDGTLNPALRRQLQELGLQPAEIKAIENSIMQAKAAGDKWAAGKYQNEVKLINADFVIGKIGAIAGAIRAIPSTKTVTVNAVGSGLALARAEGGIDLKMAKGGITSHFVTSPTVLYGERGDEAYIAKNASKDRSRAIVEQVAEKWLGGHVSWADGRGASGASPAGTMNAGVGGGGGTDTALLVAIARLQTAVESSRGGDVYLDGRRVGAIQGRETDLYERAG